MIEDSDDMSVLLHRRPRKARWRHICDECRREIKPGENYQVERVVFDGNCNSYKICAHCQAVRSYLSHHCGGWVYTCLQEDLQGHYYSTASNDSLSRETRLLTLGMKARWRRVSGSLWPIPGIKTKGSRV